MPCWVIRKREYDAVQVLPRNDLDRRACPEGGRSASVTMLYFGYLRRDPDAEDIDTRLEFMNNDPQAYRQVVQALINSAEYRSRFGQQ